MWTYRLHARANQPLFAPNTISMSSLPENHNFRRELVIDLYEDGVYSGWSAMVPTGPKYRDMAQFFDLVVADELGMLACIALNVGEGVSALTSGRTFTAGDEHA